MPLDDAAFHDPDPAADLRGTSTDLRSFSSDDDPDADDPASAAEIEECLRLLDEVWPRDEPQDPTHTIPRQLGRFRIIRELGRGGFGVVFLAEDSLLGRRVALKVPRVEILTVSGSWRRFLREARAASRLDHPNLVPLLEAGAIGPVGYIVSAYIAGPSLDRWQKGRDERVPARWAARLVMTLARAVGHVHQQGILHLDLKPANVLLQAPGAGGEDGAPEDERAVPLDSWIPRICDFGLARLHEIDKDETRSLVICGSPPYMAPEQAESRRDEMGPATDVYGLGTILYELLTGRPPFEGWSHLETLRRVVAEEPAPPRHRRSDVPRDLETICLKCLAKRPSGRYATAAELANDLDRFLDGRPIAARPVPLAERAVRWGRRNPVAAVLVLAVSLAAVAGVAGLVWHTRVLRDANARLVEEKGKAEHESSMRGRQLVGSRLFSAQQTLLAGNFERARRLVERIAPELGPPERRPFSWCYLNESVRDHIERFTGHEGFIGQLLITPDSRTMISGDAVGQVRIWDLANGRCRAVIPAAKNAIAQLAVSPDGTALASADRVTGLIELRELATGRYRGRLDDTGRGEVVWVLKFDPDGRRIAAVRTGGDRRGPRVSRWDLTRQSAAFPQVAENVRSARDDGHSAAVVRSLAGLLDPGGAAAEPMPPVRPRVPDEAEPLAVAATIDEEITVVCEGHETFTVYWRTTDVPLAHIIRGPNRTVVIRSEPGLPRGASTPAIRQRFARLARTLVPIEPLNPSPPRMLNGGTMRWASTSEPGSGSLLQWNEALKRLVLLDWATGQEGLVSDLGPLSGVSSMALSNDGTMLAAGCEDGTVRLLHRRAQPRVKVLKGHTPDEAWGLSFAPDGKTIATSGDDGPIRLCDVDTGSAVALLRKHYSLVSSVAFSPDGTSLASASFDQTTRVLLWDVAGRRPRAELRGHQKHVRCIAYSPVGDSVVTGSEDNTTRLWDPRDGRLLTRLPMPSDATGPSTLAYSPDGRTIAAGWKHGLFLVDVATGTLSEGPIHEETNAVRFTVDGSRLLSGHADGSIRAWDARTWTSVWQIPGHGGMVLHLAVSPDGAVFASGGEDRTVRVWDIVTGQEQLYLTDCRARVNTVAFSPDNRVLAAVDHSGALTIWNARPRP